MSSIYPFHYHLKYLIVRGGVLNKNHNGLIRQYLHKAIVLDKMIAVDNTLIKG